MNTILTAIRQPWSFMRIFRLSMGLYILVNSLLDNQYMFAAIGAFFAYQGLMNAGCGACAVPMNDTTKENELTEYEEITKTIENEKF